MATGDQTGGKGTIAAIIAAIAAVLVAIFGNFQNIVGDNQPKASSPPNPNAATTQPNIKAEDGSVVINNSTAGRDITVGKEPTK